MERPAQTPLIDHVRYVVELMERGARMRLDDIPGDSSLMSSSFSKEVTQEIARIMRMLLDLDDVSRET